MLKITAKTPGEPRVLECVGTLDAMAEAELLRATAELPAGGVELDLRGVEFINSIGLQLWDRFLRAAAQRGPVSMSHCSVFFVDYANLVRHVVGSATVVSFFTPYRCPHCGKSSEALVDAPAAKLAGDLPKASCQACGQETALAVDAAEYLSFLM